MIIALPESYDSILEELWHKFDGVMCITLKKEGRFENIECTIIRVVKTYLIPIFNGNSLDDSTCYCGNISKWRNAIISIN